MYLFIFIKIYWSLYHFKIVTFTVYIVHLYYVETTFLFIFLVFNLRHDIGHSIINALVNIEELYKRAIISLTDSL